MSESVQKVSIEVASCGNCGYYHGMTKTCRRFPPAVLFLGLRPVPLKPGAAEPMISTHFPAMLPHGWCGEHRYRSSGEMAQ